MQTLGCYFRIWCPEQFRNKWRYYRPIPEACWRPLHTVRRYWRSNRFSTRRSLYGIVLAFVQL